MADGATIPCPLQRQRRPVRDAPLRAEALDGRFLMTLPLIAVIAGWSLARGLCHVSLDAEPPHERVHRPRQLRDPARLDTFWMVIWQSCIFAVTAVVLKALIGFWLAHMLHHLPTKGQRKWRGMLLIPWVIPPALSTLGWWWMFEPSYSSINWLIAIFGVPPVPWLGSRGGHASADHRQCLVRRALLHDHVPGRAEIVPEQLYEAAAIDGATGWQKLRYVTLPMMRNIISITCCSA
jgi:multiple sugar transport system permease protein